MSVEAPHERLIPEGLAAVAVKLVGTDGAIVSGVVTLIALVKAETFGTASYAAT